MTLGPLGCRSPSTGSTDVGKIIIKAAADSVKKVTMELGGKNPLIIWKDVDIKQVSCQHHELLASSSGAVHPKSGSGCCNHGHAPVSASLACQKRVRRSRK